MLTQPDICAIRIEIAPAAAMSPGLARPASRATRPAHEDHRQHPAIAMSASRNQDDTTPKSSARSR
jgi:hypothetical protein